MKASRMVGILFAVAFLLYILSPGPVARYYFLKGERKPVAVRTFYSPLEWLAHKPVIAEAYYHYFRMWASEPDNLMVDFE